MVTDRNTSPRRWRCCALSLLSLLITLVATLTVLVIHYDTILSTRKDDKTYSDPTSIDQTLEEPQFPSVFHDLTHEETKSIIHYLLTTSEFNLQDNKRANLNDSFLYFAELQLPNKSIALDHFDLGHKPPPREAKVVMLRGDKTPPVVEEYVVGPLPEITGHRLLISKHHKESAPYLFRPMTSIEYKEIQRLLRVIDKNLKIVLQESYDSSFFDCEDKCLVMKYYTSVSPVSSGTNRRLLWFLAYHDVEYFMLNPVDFAVLFNTEGSDASKFTIERIWYNDQDFATTDHLFLLYKADSIKKSFYPFPVNQKEHFSSSTLRGNQFPFKNYRSPKEILPDSQRFSVKDGRVTYMNWAFYFRMSTQNGPQLFDIRHNSNRIIYELSLQEIAVFHSGYQPWVRYSNIVQSSRLLGVHTKNLVPGVDCPNYALFLSHHHLHQNLHRSTNKNSICIFEHSTGFPLRRHSTFSEDDRQFYVGLESIILILRSIITIFNHDFVIDFMFYQNGVLEVKVGTTGFPFVTIISPQEARYGYRIHDNIYAGIEQTMFNFKVDIDVMGLKNRLKTIEITKQSIRNGDWSKYGSSKHSQLKISEKLHMTELQAAFKQTSNHPKYFMFYNNGFSSDYKNYKGYILQIDGGYHQVLSENIGNEASVSWARYNMAVTNRKEHEGRSSSIYSPWDVKTQMVNFQEFLDDNESILDKDLVSWVTLRSYNMYSTESLPVVQTAGRSKSFYVMPFNYYLEDPSLSSRDALRIDKDEQTVTENYGLPKLYLCQTEKITTTHKNETSYKQPMYLFP